MDICTKILLFLTCFTGTLCNEERRIVNKLLADYDPRIRPVKNSSTATFVYMSVWINQIIEVGVKEETFTANLVLSMDWHDELLKWNNSENKGFERLVLDSKNVWVPEIVLERTRDDNGQLAKLNSKVWVSSPFSGNGAWVSWWNSFIVKVHCDLNVETFPYDSQTCSYHLSQHYFGNELRFKKIYTKKVSGYRNHSEWDLIEIELRNKRDDDDYTGEELVVDVKIKRKSSYYVQSLIIPMVFIDLSMVFTFVLPAKSGERVVVAALLFITQCLFMHHMYNIIPTSYDNPPKLAKFFCASIVGSAIILMLHCIVIRLYFRRDAISNWAKRYVIEKLSRYLCVSDGNNNKSESSKIHFYKTSSKREINQLLIDDNPKEDQISSAQSAEPLADKIDEILINLNTNKQKSHLDAEWNTVGQTFDRLLFLLYLIVYITLFCIYCLPTK